MPRKLKTYQTSIGFYDLAVAAPSMKAALDAWGASSNLFHQGAALEVDDPAVIAATLAKPGVVLKRPVGSDGKFGEQAGLLKLTDSKTSQKPTAAKSKKSSRAPAVNDADQRKAALQFDKEQKLRDAKRRRGKAARAKEDERRQRAADKAQSALVNGEREHDKRVGALEAEHAAVERRLKDEEERWKAQREKLEAALLSFQDATAAVLEEAEQRQARRCPLNLHSFEVGDRVALRLRENVIFPKDSMRKFRAAEVRKIEVHTGQVTLQKYAIS